MKRSTIVVAVVAALVFSACGSDKKSGSSEGKPAAGATVYVAAPLQGIVATLMQVYNKANPSLPLRLPPTAATALVLSASVARSRPGVEILPTAWITKVGVGATKASFGRNLAVIAVPAANPHHIAGLSSFASTSGLRTAACGPKSPFGNGPFLVLLKSKIRPAKDTLTFDCSKVMNDLATGKLDAALLYRIGLTPSSGVKLLTVPDAQNVILSYSYVLVGKSPTVVAFGKFVASTVGQDILKLRGYLP